MDGNIPVRQQGKDLGFMVGQGHLPVQVAHRDVAGTAAIGDGQPGTGR